MTDKTKKQIMQDCRRAMMPTVVLYIIGDLLGIVLTVYIAHILGRFADSVLQLQQENGLRDVAIIAVCLLVQFGVKHGFSIIGESVMLRNVLLHDRCILSRYLSKTYESVLPMSEGEAQSRLENDPIDFRCDYVDLLTKLILVPVIAGYLLYHMIRMDWVFTCAVIGISAVKLLVPIFVSKIQAKYEKERKEYRTHLHAAEQEMTGNAEKIKMLGIKTPFVKKMMQIHSGYYEKSYRKNVKQESISRNLMLLLNTFCMLLIVFSGAVLVAYDRITPGVIAAMLAFFPIFDTVYKHVGDIIRRAPVFANETERMAIFYENGEENDGKKIEKISQVEVKNLSYAYQDKTVLQPIDFTVTKGEKVAFTGENGAGKSTVLWILTGLLQNYSGKVLINGINVKEISLSSYRKAMSYVPQIPYIFEGDVLQNVWIGNPEADKKQVLQVMHLLHMENLVDRKTSFSEKALSGGEKQKIAIARALLKNTDFLIMDEPNNNLDAETTAFLIDFIKTCNKTVLFVSHTAALDSAATRKIHLIK